MHIQSRTEAPGLKFPHPDKAAEGSGFHPCLGLKVQEPERAGGACRTPQGIRQLLQDFVTCTKALFSLHATIVTSYCKALLEHIFHLLLFTPHPQLSALPLSWLSASNFIRNGTLPICYSPLQAGEEVTGRRNLGAQPI